MDKVREQMKADIMRMIVTPLLDQLAKKQARIEHLEDKLKGLDERDLRVARANAADRIG